jgi:hypothetical protein
MQGYSFFCKQIPPRIAKVIFQIAAHYTTGHLCAQFAWSEPASDQQVFCKLAPEIRGFSGEISIDSRRVCLVASAALKPGKCRIAQ